MKGLKSIWVFTSFSIFAYTYSLRSKWETSHHYTLMFNFALKRYDSVAEVIE